MKKYQKVILYSKGDKGKTGRVLFESNNTFKIEMEGNPDNVSWFRKNLLRYARMKTPCNPIEEGVCIKVVDYSTNPKLKDFIGRGGHVVWSDGYQMTVDLGEDRIIYCETGDIKEIPKQKLGWVVWDKKIIRMKLTRIRVDKGEIVWKTDNNYKVNDNIVFDSFTKALDRVRLNNPKEGIYKVIND